MNFVFTAHARLRMALRGVSEDMVKATITDPDRHGKGYMNRLLAFKRFDRGILKVVYTLEDEHAIIITVIWE